MVTIPFSHFHPREVHSASESVITLCTPYSENNLFLFDYLAALSIKVTQLSASIDQDSSIDLTEQARREDRSLEINYKDLKMLTGMKADMDSLGEEAVACRVLVKSIADHGKKIEGYTRSVQITTMDTLLAKWAEESFQEVINKANVRPLYQDVVDAHLALKKTESIRNTVSADSEGLTPMWEAKRNVTPLLSRIYSHITDYAAIENEQYRDLLVSLNTKLAPISAQVRSRIARTGAV